MEYASLHGKEKEYVAGIFISIFPYQGITKLILGYRKKDEKELKQYINRIFKEKENRLLRQITNLLLFQCETWVVSQSFYKSRIKSCEEYFGYATRFANSNSNERKFFNLNLFHDSFCNQIKLWWKDVNRQMD